MEPHPKFNARSQRLARAIFAAAFCLLISACDRAHAQIPGLPTLSPPPASEKPAKPDDPVSVSTKENGRATVAVSKGQIATELRVDDTAIRKTLEDLLPKYPGVRSVSVAVSNGVATLDGLVRDDDLQDDITDFTRKVEGVRLVLNRMKTDAEVMSATQLAGSVLAQFGTTIAQKWLLVVLAITIGLLFFVLARLFGRYSETVLSPFVKNVMLRSVVGSLLTSLLILGGIMLALSVLHLTQAVLSILGLAGVVGLAVGFAFRDIAENFIASILLGVRRPFRIGDYIQVAGQAGVVLTLNTRATVLVTLEGNHIRIPNNIIYKEIMVNSSASASSRGTFDVLIPYQVSTATALEAVNRALKSLEGLVTDPPPRALVEALEPEGVRLRSYFWMPSQGVDGYKLQSDIKLKVKVGLQEAGIFPPPAAIAITVMGRVPVDLCEVNNHDRPEAAARNGSVVTPEQAAANLRRDSRAAEKASAVPVDGLPTPVEHVLSQAESRVSEEGTNLLDNGQLTHS